MGYSARFFKRAILLGLLPAEADANDALSAAQQQSDQHFQYISTGYCYAGYYAGWLAADADMDACKAKCASEPRCKYFSLKLGKSCSRYDDRAGALPADCAHNDYADYNLYKKSVGTQGNVRSFLTHGEWGASVAGQDGARFDRGHDIRLFVIGSSNVLWQTWVDQTQLMLNMIGYRTPVIDKSMFGNGIGVRLNLRPGSQAPTCDDSADMQGSETLRLGKPGWSSWGFAYESNDTCDSEGYRTIAGIKLSCTNGWMCDARWTGSVPFEMPGELAEVASGSDVTVLANWKNDEKLVAACSKRDEDGRRADANNSTQVTIDSLRLLIRAIHHRNPKVVVVVLGQYPDATGVLAYEASILKSKLLNSAVKAGLSAEPNTVFADHAFPPHAKLFQKNVANHPNCRGDKILAASVVNALFHAKVLSRGLAMGDLDSCLGRPDCASLTADLACCQRSVYCWPVANRTCAPYSGERP